VGRGTKFPLREMAVISCRLATLASSYPSVSPFHVTADRDATHLDLTVSGGQGSRGSEPAEESHAEKDVGDGVKLHVCECVNLLYRIVLAWAVDLKCFISLRFIYA
jgi:hypothetical protein